jgi:competence protein ComEC
MLLKRSMIKRSLRLLKILCLTIVFLSIAACNNAGLPEIAAAPIITREVAAVSTATPQTLPEPAEQEATAESPDAAPAAVFVPLVVTPQGELIAHYFDVGQGDATLLAGPDFTILIDAGRHDRSDVVPHLVAAGVQAIDLLVGTHPHADHIGQFPAVLGQFPVTEVWMPGNTHTTLTFERAIDAILGSGAAYHEPRAGEVYQIGTARVEVVNPESLTGNLHQGSVSLRIIFGEVAFLFTGDAEAPTEAAMIARGHPLHAQILQLGHHGSRTSSTLAFLQAVNPEVAIYSAGRNNSYGHPHDEVIDRLRSLGIAIYGTDVNGAVRVISDGATYRVEPSVGQALQSLAPARLQPAATPLIEAPAVSGSCRPDQVNVNSASADELVRIIHIGPERAGQILRLRPFSSVDDMVRISGIGSARLRDIKGQGLACVQ